MTNQPVKVDLRLHSNASDTPQSWVLRQAKCPSSFTAPAQAYEAATARGMDLVTLCDHDSIQGALALKELGDNTFISETVTARFPEDGCLVHLVALNITEAQHTEIQRLRRNIYELTPYLKQAGITSFLSQPLASVNNRLKPHHLQQCLLMVENIEVLSGAQPAESERALRKLVASLTPDTLNRWAAQFPKVPRLNALAEYGLVGGSGDYSGLSVGRAFTSFEGAPTALALTQAMNAQRTEARGTGATPTSQAHNILGSIGGFLATSGQLDLDAGMGDEDETVPPSPISTMTLKILEGLMNPEEGGLDLETIQNAGHTDAVQAKLFRGMESALVGLNREAFSQVKVALGASDLGALTGSVSALVTNLLAGLPYLLTAQKQAAQKRAGDKLAGALGARPESATQTPKVAVLSDSLDSTNGVAIGLRRLADEARRSDLDFQLVGLGKGSHVETDDAGVVRIPAIFEHAFEEYPEMTFGIPNVPSLLQYVQDEGIELIQCSTPGPMGFAGLLVGRLLNIPVAGQYHTDVPEYVERLCDDPALGAIVSKVTGWFFSAMDSVLTPSQAIKEKMIAMGVPADKIQQVPRGIDLRTFSPELRQHNAFADFGLNGEPKILYVGRISREKNLDPMFAAAERIHAKIPAAKLILVGDGPYAQALKARYQDKPWVVFTGEKFGKELATLYASSDVFVCPSETETFGNVVVEAQAAGLPVVVANKGGACEQVAAGKSGIIVDASVVRELESALLTLLTDKSQRIEMGQRATRFAAKYNMESALAGTFEIYRGITKPAPHPTVLV